nr:hypothetical protein [Burkholderia latens]
MHAAEPRDVDRNLRRVGAGGIPAIGNGVAVDLHVAVQRDPNELLRPRVGIDTQRARDQIDVGIRRIEPLAFDHEATARFEARDAAILIEHRLAGHERRASCIDEPGAVCHEAVRIGDDEPGRLPGDFRRAVESRHLAAGHLVQNDPGGCAAELRVAGDRTRELRMNRRGTVVQNQPIRADVVIGETVMRQTGCIRRGDVDDRRPADRRDARLCGGTGIRAQDSLTVRSQRRHHQRKRARQCRTSGQRAPIRELMGDSVFHGASP